MYKMINRDIFCYRMHNKPEGRGSVTVIVSGNGLSEPS